MRSGRWQRFRCSMPWSRPCAAAPTVPCRAFPCTTPSSGYATTWWPRPSTGRSSWPCRPHRHSAPPFFGGLTRPAPRPATTPPSSRPSEVAWWSSPAIPETSRSRLPPISWRHGPCCTTRNVVSVGGRVGIGFDMHPFSDDPARPLVLGGVELPGYQGLAGHSDADVVAHAVADALLGAAGLGDLGERFPDTDPAWSGADSR